MIVIECGLAEIQRKNERDQLWFTGETWEEWRWSAVGYQRYRGGMIVISCGLPAKQGRNEGDQLWVNGDTWEEWMWLAVGYRRWTLILKYGHSVYPSIWFLLI